MSSGGYDDDGVWFWNDPEDECEGAPDDDDAACDHDCDEDCEAYGCHHEHCPWCGGCGCPGYCDDYQSYNLRPDETGGGNDG